MIDHSRLEAAWWASFIGDALAMPVHWYYDREALRRSVERILARGSLGLGESYMDGWWDCAQLDGLVARILRARLDEKVGAGALLFLPGLPLPRGVLLVGPNGVAGKCRGRTAAADP